MATTKVEVKIFDEYYPLRSEGDGIQYIKQLSAMLDERLKNVADSKHRLSRARVAVVTALQIADEYCRLHGEKTELENSIKDMEAVRQENIRLQAQLGQLKEEQAQNEDAVKRATEKLKNEVECLVESNTKLIMEKRELVKAKAEHAAAKQKDSEASANWEAEKQELTAAKTALENEKLELEELKLKYSGLIAERDRLATVNTDLKNINQQLKAELAEAKAAPSADSGLQKKYDILSKAHAKLKKDYSEMMDILEELSK